MNKNLARLAKIARLAGIATLLAVALPTATAAAASPDLTVPQAERKALALINDLRAELGLVAVLQDSRMNRIARARSEYMAQTGTFSHTHEGGRYAWDLMDQAGIEWFDAGEIIAWTSYPALTDAADAAARMWRNSPDHYALLSAERFNYVGVGLAVAADGKKYWTMVFLQGPDRTGAVARFDVDRTQAPGNDRSARSSLKLDWSGADVPLSVLTAGLKDFQISYRVDRGAWRWLLRSTVRTSGTFDLPTGHTYDFRIRARDNAGNVGRWTAPESFGL